MFLNKARHGGLGGDEALYTSAYIDAAKRYTRDRPDIKDDVASCTQRGITL